MHFLTDDRQMTTLFSDGDLNRIVGLTLDVYGPLGRTFKCAAVFGSDVQHGIGRVFTAKSESTPIDFASFRDLQAAKDWLGISDDASIV